MLAPEEAIFSVTIEPCKLEHPWERKWSNLAGVQGIRVQALNFNYPVYSYLRIMFFNHSNTINDHFCTFSLFYKSLLIGTLSVGSLAKCICFNKGYHIHINCN